jgi:hypothetical protein
MTQAAPTTAAVAKPVALTLMGPGHVIFQELAVHIRDGYVPNPDYPVEFFQNGHVSIMCVLGNPTQYAIDKARESHELALAQQEAEFQRAVQAEAKRLAEQAARDELERKIAAVKADQAKAIRELEKATAAEIAKLSK